LGLFFYGEKMYPQKSSDVLGQLNTFRQSRRNPMDYLRDSETRLGLPSSRQRLEGLRGAIGNTENLLRGVDPSVTGRTQGSLVSEAQRQRMVNLEREPLGEQFREQSRALEGETSTIEDLARRSLSEAQLGIGEQESQQKSLESLYSTLFQREQEEEQKRRWQEEFSERRRQSDRQAAELAAQTAALRNAIRLSEQTPIPNVSAPPPSLQSIFGGSTPGLVVRAPNTQANILQSAGRVQPQVTASGSSLQGNRGNAARGSGVPRVRRPWEY
jgi:hypothetical protein